jgi:hypothetical protein
MRRDPSSRALLRRAFATGIVAGGIVLAAAGSGCGSRGPLDDTPFPLALDAGADVSSTADASSVNAKSRDSGLEAGSIAACGVCVLSTCSTTVIQCIQSASCISVFQCVASTCIGLGGARDGGAAGGGLNTGCLLGCIEKDPQALVDLLAILKCVSGDCGPDCGSALGSLGSLGGLGGLGGGGGGGHAEARAFSEVFAPWPEVLPAPATENR